MNDYQLRFLMQSVLGQQVNMNNSEAVIKKCIELADRDMMSGGRFVSDCFELKTKEKRVDCFLDELKKQDYIYTKIDKEELCNRMFWKCDEVKTTTVHGVKREYRPFGLSQKLINMTYKYLYVFKAHIGRSIDFSKCECPLDSVVLRKLGCHSKWTNLTVKEYDCIQTKIKDALSNENRYTAMKAEIGALAFDDNWINSET